MEIKYEPVFGDQALFDGMIGDCEFASEEYGYKFANGELYYCERYNEKAGWALSCKSNLTFKPSAMRRIIKTPVWTVADQQAGRLPEVGVKCIWVDKSRAPGPEGMKYPNTGCEVEIIAHYENVNNSVAVFKFKTEGGVYVAVSMFEDDFKPIETQAEKAQRLREEWKNNVIEIHHGKRRKMSTSTFLLDDIYDALLSGDLPVPVSPEQNK